MVFYNNCIHEATVYYNLYTCRNIITTTAYMRWCIKQHLFIYFVSNNGHGVYHSAHWVNHSTETAGCIAALRTWVFVSVVLLFISLICFRAFYWVLFVHFRSLFHTVQTMQFLTQESSLIFFFSSFSQFKFFSECCHCFFY